MDFLKGINFMITLHFFALLKHYLGLKQFTYNSNKFITLLYGTILNFLHDPAAPARKVIFIIF